MANEDNKKRIKAKITIIAQGFAKNEDEAADLLEETLWDALDVGYEENMHGWRIKSIDVFDAENKRAVTYSGEKNNV